MPLLGVGSETASIPAEGTRVLVEGEVTREFWLSTSREDGALELGSFDCAALVWLLASSTTGSSLSSSVAGRGTVFRGIFPVATGSFGIVTLSVLFCALGSISTANVLNTEAGVV